MDNTILFFISIPVGLVIVFLILVFLYGYTPRQTIFMMISMCIFAGLVLVVLNLAGLFEDNIKIPKWIGFTVWALGVIWFLGSLVILSRIRDSKICS